MSQGETSNPAQDIRLAIDALHTQIRGRRYGGKKRLAALLKHDVATIARWMNGKGSPTHTELQKIIEIAKHPERWKE